MRTILFVIVLLSPLTSGVVSVIMAEPAISEQTAVLATGPTFDRSR